MTYNTLQKLELISEIVGHYNQIAVISLTKLFHFLVILAFEGTP